VFTVSDGDAASKGALAKDDVSKLAVIKETAVVGEHVKKDGGEEGVVKPDDVLREAAVGKGLAGALRLLQDRGTLNEAGDKTTNRKKSKPSIKDGPKEIHIERTDEFGRVVSNHLHAPTHPHTWVSYL
jgi:U4/U6.U5 tri-snRNP-associated protein 1